MEYETTIPFSGFYESLHSMALDEALNSMFGERDTGNPVDAFVDYANDAMDWKAVHTEYAREYAEAFASFVELELKFEALESPREYNFTTDVIICKISEASLLKAYERVDKAVLKDVAELRHTSRDGFSSFYGPDYTAWGEVIEWDCNQIGTLMQALAEGESGEFNGMCEYVLMEYAMCNGVLENTLYTNCSDADRLCKIFDYLEDRKERV